MVGCFWLGIQLTSVQYNWHNISAVKGSARVAMIISVATIVAIKSRSKILIRRLRGFSIGPSGLRGTRAAFR